MALIGRVCAEQQWKMWLVFEQWRSIANVQHPNVQYRVLDVRTFRSVRLKVEIREIHEIHEIQFT